MDVGLHTPADISAKTKNTSGAEVRWNWQLGATYQTFWRIGRHLDSQWRVELEAGFRPTDIDSTYTAGATPTGLCSTSTGAPAYPACRPETGRFDTFSAMVNGLYAPWGQSARISPFVGLGAGLAVTQVEAGGRLPILPPNNGAVTGGTDDTSTAPAVQAIAGVTLRLSPRLSADVLYRYFYVHDLKWQFAADSYSFADTAFTVPVFDDKFAGDLKDQSISLALRWNFDLGG